VVASPVVGVVTVWSLPAVVPGAAALPRSVTQPFQVV
jgi:hypothetical protein